MSRFESLTLELEAWFELALRELPDALRDRLSRECPIIPWDHLSAEQRRSAIQQHDYQHDPATQAERQFWWDFFVRKEAIIEQIKQWEAITAPTAQNLAQKEARLTELRQEFARMEQQELRGRGAYHRGKAPLTSATQSSADTDPDCAYFAYPIAMRRLAVRLAASLEELAAWVWTGPKAGGLAAYLNANELDPPPRFYYSLDGDSNADYLSPLMACWFLKEDIANFDPTDRYITGQVLLERWSGVPGLLAEAYIRAKISESRLMDMHPMTGATQWTEDATWPRKESALFPLSCVLAIEEEDGLEVPSMANDETPEERAARLRRWFEEENARIPSGALNRTAAREGIARQTLKQILDRDPAEVLPNPGRSPKKKR